MLEVQVVSRRSGDKVREILTSSQVGHRIGWRDDDGEQECRGRGMREERT